MSKSVLLFAIALFLMVSTASTFADVIEDDAFLKMTGVGEYRFGIEAPDDHGLLLFDIIFEGNGDYSVDSLGIAELTILFEVPLGTVFDAGYVMDNVPLASNETSTNGVFNLNVGESFYMGYFDDRYDFPSEEGNEYGPDNWDNYGWAEIERTNSGLELLGSATAINYGIIVGTTNQIPEPAGFAVLILVSMSCQLRRHRKVSAAG